MPLLIFLHTAAVHVQTFDALLRELEPRIAARHLVRSDLLARARTHGIEDANLRGAVRQDRNRASKDVKDVAMAKLADLDRKILELHSLRDALAHLVHNCHGDSRPECPILQDLAGIGPSERAKETEQ